MVGITSVFARPSDAEVKNERLNDIVIGQAVRILYCRIRQGWMQLGGVVMRDRGQAEAYADKMVLFLRCQVIASQKN